MSRFVPILRPCCARLLLPALMASVAPVGSVLAQSPPPSFDPGLFSALTWRNIGPTVGGRVVAIAGVPSDPLTYYHGTVGGGVWKTEDAGQSWRNVSDGFLGTSSVGALAVAGSDPNVIYVGMGEGPVKGAASSHGDGVYRSNDAGRTWEHRGLERTRQISKLVVHPADEDVVYVAAQGAAYGPTPERGIYRSIDGGLNWELVLHVDTTTGASDVSMDPDNPRVLYAAMWDHHRRPWEIRSGGPGSGIYRSTDGGDSWSPVNEGLPAELGKIGVAATPGSDRVYAIVEADPGGGVFRSEDRGGHWTLVNEDWRLRSRAWYYMHVVADPTDADHVWVLNNPLMRSIDGGRTFTSVLVEHGDVHALWINPRDTRIMINGNDGGASVTLTGGGSWSTQANQPTGQFYRINTDNLYPYRAYAAQQDRSTVRISSAPPAGDRLPNDWDPVGGCESAHIAFDPDHPRLVYAGCYLGLITEFDDRNGFIRDVMAYPEVHAGIAPRDIRYRFNWNFPILTSRHDRSVLYQAAQVVLRSEDRGQTWEEISPDLTTDDESRQGPGGRPITNEIVSLENYTTILSLSESPHHADEIWAGSDDGLLHRTTDGGVNWENITPPGMGEAMINAVELSVHDPAKAYIAVSRYEFNDLTPMAYRTVDAGRTWTSIASGIPEESWVHVVREDPLRPGLLYAGTETGVMVSFDDGAQWQDLQLNLPVVPVTDLKVQREDLVISTQGRALWVLDDVSPLRQWSESVAAASEHLFAPAPAVRMEPSGRATIDVYFATPPSAGVAVEIRDGRGQVVRTLGEGLQWRSGLNRVVWNLRHESLPNIPGVETPRVPLPGIAVADLAQSHLAGRRVVPGDYEIRLFAGGDVQSQTLRVVVDPRAEATVADLQEQDALLAQVDRELAGLHTAITQLRSVRDQVEALLSRIEDGADVDAVRTAGASLTDSLTTLEGVLVQTRTTSSVQTVINFRNRLNYHYVALRLQVDAADGAPTAGQHDRFTDLSGEWSGHRAHMEGVLRDELGRFNELVRELGLPAVMVEGRRRPIS